MEIDITKFDRSDWLKVYEYLGEHGDLSEKGKETLGVLNGKIDYNQKDDKPKQTFSEARPWH